MRSLILVVVLVLAPARAMAQSLPFKHYTSDDGLAQSVVMALHQDRDGYLWLGTPDGLSRFDGLAFLDVGEAEGLPDQVIRVLHEDDDGTLWVGTDGGLARRPPDGRDDAWQVVPLADLPRFGVRCLARAGGALWVGTFGQGLIRLDDDGAGQLTATRFTTSDGLPHDRIRALLRDHADRLWIGTFGGGVSVYEDGRFVSFGVEQGLADLGVRSLLEDRNGRVYAGTSAGLFRWTGDGFERWAPAADLAKTLVSSLLEDRRGRLWIGTRDRGVCRTDLDRGAVCYGITEGLADNSVNCLLEDREGNLWLGTFGGGASRLSSESFRNYTARDGLIGGGVQAFAQDDDGALWIGTHGGGLAVLRDGVVTAYGPADGLPHEKVLAVRRDPAGGVWAGTLEGAARWHDGRFTSFTTADGLSHSVVYDILRDREGTVWLGTFEGLTAVRDGRVRVLGVADGLPDARVNVLLEARDGSLWLGTGGGLARMVGGEVREVYRETDGLADGFVHDLLERADGSLWIATSGGLSRFADGELGVFTAAGLPHDKSVVVLEDRGGRLWIGTTHGVSIFDGETVTTFDAKDGLVSSEIVAGAGLVDRDGRLWLGTSRGAVVFEPDAEARRPPPPRVQMIGLEVLGRPVPLDAELSFPASDNDLHFDFLGISLTFPEEIVYEYRLDPLDHRWRTTTARSADYPAVPPGAYELRVRASLADGQWGRPAVLRLEITPPLWRATWLQVLVGVTVVALVWAGHRARLGVLRRQKEQLEEVVRERTADVRRERREVKKKNDELEITHLIVQQINAELEFDNLLQSILEGVSFVHAADCALALVLDTDRGQYEIKAPYSWPGARAPEVLLERREIDEGLLAQAERISARACRGTLERADGPALRALERRLGSLPRAYLVIIIELPEEIAGDADKMPAGYLVFGNRTDPRAFADADAEVLAGLEVHVTSAFVKGRMMDELRRLNDKKNEFLGIAAHDLRSPLGSIKSCSELLLRFLDEDRVDKEVWARFLTNIRTTAEQMHALVNDLLDVAAIESGRIELQIARQRMSELLEEQETFQTRVAARKEIALEVDKDSAGVEVLADRIRLREVLDNLLTNAVKYTPPGGRIRVYCEPVNGEVFTHIEDTGLGLEPAELEHAFSGRKLSSRPTAGETSTGLGLVIAKKLVELHGGRIWVVSEKNVGSTFSFSLPRAGPDGPNPDGSRPSAHHG